MILELTNIAKSFGRKRILQEVNLHVESGSMIGITGENGSGKSTLLKIIIGELKANKGKIKREGRIGYCPQECVLFSQLTIRENFIYFAKAYGLTANDSRKRQDFLSDFFNFNDYMKQRVDSLSGGTRQKVNLCVALLHDPDILILDEPYVGFDWNTYEKFWEYTKELIDNGTTIVIVAHLLTKLDAFDRIFEIYKGRLK